MSTGLRARFERIYANAEDPWSYETSAYEAEKYSATLEALPGAVIGRALEMGCSIGVFTARLAERSEHVIAADFSARAIAAARRRLAGVGNVTIERRDLRRSLPAGPFDLIVCSELLYYWNAREVETALDQIEERLAPEGSLVAANWLGRDPRAPLGAREVEAAIDARRGLDRVLSRRTGRYTLGRWART